MLVPLRGKVLVEVLEDNKRSESGIYLTGIKEEVPHRGLVINIGLPFMDKKCREYPWGFLAGHIAHFNRVWDQNKVKNYILKREQIFAIECNDEAFAIGEYVIIKRCDEVGTGLIFVPSHFESEVAKEVGYGIVMSVGKENRMGINVGDKIMCFKNEGLAVRIPLKEELWALKPRAILAKA